MRTDMSQGLGADLYPSESLHRHEIENYFKGKPLRPLSAEEKQLLGDLDIFFVAFSNRSGSTLLTELLYQAGVAVPPRAEIFNSESVIDACIEHGISTFTDYFMQVVGGWHKSGLVGFKIGPRQLFWLTQSGFLTPFKSVKIVNSVRHDRVLQAVSLYIARNTGQWHSGMQKLQEVEGLAYSAIDIARALKQVTDDQLLVEYYAQLHQLPRVETTYEELLKNPRGEITDVLKFLGVSVPPDFGVDISAVNIARQYSGKNRELAEKFRQDFSLN